MHHENISRNDHHPSLIDQPPDMLKTNVDSEPDQEGQTNGPLKSPVTTMALIKTVSTDASEKKFRSAQWQRERQPILADAIVAPTRSGQAPAFTSFATLHINLKRTINLHSITGKLPIKSS